MEKRIRTTMIGAIAAIEEILEKEIASNEEINQKFKIIRDKILDLGNNQIRLLRKDKEDEERSKV